MFRPACLMTAILLLSAMPLFAQTDGRTEVGALTPGAEAGETIGAHRFILDFEQTATEEMDSVRLKFEQDGVFKEVLDEFADQIALPQDVPVTFKDCGMANAFWDPNEKTLTMCYELIAKYNTGYEQITGAEETFLKQADRETVLAGTTLFILLHELGHGMVDLFDLPITGREEDAVDQFAAITLIDSDEEDDTLEERPSRLALLGAYFFQQLSFAPEEMTRHIFSNEHALGQQRYYDVMCLVLGANTELYGPILALGIQMVDDAATRYPDLVNEERVMDWLEKTDDLNILPYQRALRCEAEYARYSASWNYLVDTFMVPQQN